MKFSFAKLLSTARAVIRGCAVLQKAPDSIRKQSLGSLGCLFTTSYFEYFSAVIITIDFNTFFDKFQRKTHDLKKPPNSHDLNIFDYAIFGEFENSKGLRSRIPKFGPLS